MPDQPTPPSADLLSRGNPALSATSDMPAPPPSPPPVSEERTPAPTGSPAPTTEATPEPSATPQPSQSAEPGSSEPSETRKPKSGIEERFSTLTARAKAAEALADQLGQRLNEAVSALERVATNATTTQAAADAKAAADADPRPDRSGFDDPNKYEDALIEWASRRATSVATAEAKQLAEKEAGDKAKADKAKEAEDAQRAEFEQIAKTFGERREKALEEFPDYHEVAERDDLRISTIMADAIMRAENGPAIAYHLGKNDAEAARIAAIANPVQQALEIGRISAQLATAKKPVTKAPDPIEPVGARANALPKGPEEESMDEYGARRQREIAEARKRPN